MVRSGCGERGRAKRYLGLLAKDPVQVAIGSGITARDINTGVVHTPRVGKGVSEVYREVDQEHFF